MHAPSPRDVTRWVHAWSDGDQQALDQWVPLVYKQLYRLVHRYMASGRSHES